MSGPLHGGRAGATAVPDKAGIVGVIGLSVKFQHRARMLLTMGRVGARQECSLSQGLPLGKSAKKSGLAVAIEAVGQKCRKTGFCGRDREWRVRRATLRLSLEHLVRGRTGLQSLYNQNHIFSFRSIYPFRWQIFTLFKSVLVSIADTLLGHVRDLAERMLIADREKAVTVILWYLTLWLYECLIFRHAYNQNDI